MVGMARRQRGQGSMVGWHGELRHGHGHGQGGHGTSAWLGLVGLRGNQGTRWSKVGQITLLQIVILI